MVRKLYSSKHKRLKISDYLRVYVGLIFASLLVFGVTFIFLNSKAKAPVCANSKSCNSDLSENIENNVLGIFEGKAVVPPVIDKNRKNDFKVMGVSAVSGEKHIYIDLSAQTLIAYQGTTQILKTFVSTGKWTNTPTGNFHIWTKLRATRMQGGEGQDAYDLPNVPYVMYFYHDFGLHGAYWHDNFGYQMSHGCVNMRQVDAKILFEWADGPLGDTKGTAVSVCDQISADNQCIQNSPIQ